MSSLFLQISSLVYEFALVYELDLCKKMLLSFLFCLKFAASLENFTLIVFHYSLVCYIPTPN